MSSQDKDNDEISSSTDVVSNGASESGGGGDVAASSEMLRPPAKRPISTAVIEISDTESDDSDICAVTSYQASADEVKRIRGDYSSSSSSSDYSSDSDAAYEDDSTVLEDSRPLGRAVRAELNPRAARTDDPCFNSSIKSQEVIDKLTEHWNEVKDYKSDDITLTSEPFRLCLLHNLLSNPDIINNIVDDMNTLDWSRKKMDLYEFHQTADLASLTWQRSIKGIYELLKTEVMTWVSQITGLNLTHISASCSLYGPGDHLLVHDDLLSDRRVAFILYLCPWKPRLPCDKGLNGAGDAVVEIEECTGWSKSMGGALELFNKDASGRPDRPAHSVYPSNNMLAFFQVGTDTFHQVCEVVSLELPRLSINGWFHGPAPPPPPPPAFSPEPEVENSKPHTEVVVLQEWLEPTYMTPRARSQIQAQMEEDSEVALRNLLLPEQYNKVLEALRDPELEWERRGPADQRSYHRVSPSHALSLSPSHPLATLCRALTGQAFCRMLHECTDLVLREYRGLEVARWEPGDYTLLPPREKYQQARLEACLHLGVPSQPLSGGDLHYTAPEEGPPIVPAPHGPAPSSPTSPTPPPQPPIGTGGALVTVPPSSNTLSLVYCDSGAVGFTKYLSKMTMNEGQCFYTISCTYLE